MPSPRYHNRDISWLSFNERILMEGGNKDLPVYERIKFLAIFSSNLDEFYRVRIPGLRSLEEISNSEDSNPEILEGYANSGELIKTIHDIVWEQQTEFGRIFSEEVIPELKSNGVFLYRNHEEIKESHKHYCENYFKSRILSYLQPVFIRKKRNAFLANRQLYLIVELRSLSNETTELAYVNIPSNELPRFIAPPKIDQTNYFIFIDDVIRLNLNRIFVGYDVIGCYSVKLNRNADLQIEDEFSGDLVEKIKTHLHFRKEGAPSRFLYDKEMPAEILKTVMKKFRLKGIDLSKGGRYHNFFDLFGLKNPKAPALQSKDWPSVDHQDLENTTSIFDAFREKDVLLHFPYHSYDYVLMFFNEAAIDPRVTEILATFYRVASDSFITNALISAARNGKKVKAFVELKARFDEENNLRWAKKMEEAGVKITYSIPRLKVHAKTALIKREDEDGVERKYAYLGTGNFNEKTANIYSDLGLLTSNTDLTEELEAVFKFLYKRKPVEHLNHLLVSQFNIVDSFKSKIDREIKIARKGEKAEITIKINNIDDPAMMDKLYEASEAGVKINFIIRSICRLIPSKPGLSDNIQARRIVGRYLEHSRVFIFHNNGQPEYYCGSADWMKRNLYHRIEVVFPIYDPELKKEVQSFIDFQLNDNTTAVTLSEDLQNIRVEKPKDAPAIEAQYSFYQWVVSKEKQSKKILVG